MRGHLDEAASLLDRIAMPGRILARTVANQRALIAIYRDDAKGAIEHASRAINGRYAWLERFQEIGQELQARGIRAIAAASCSDDALVRKDVAIIQSAPLAGTETRSQAVLAEAIVLFRQGRYDEARLRWGGRGTFQPSTMGASMADWETERVAAELPAADLWHGCRGPGAHVRGQRQKSRRFIFHQATFFAALATTSLVAAPAHAQEPIPTRAKNAWHVEGGVGTDFPIQVGLRAGLETPQRIRLSTSLGVLPRLYMNAVNGVLLGAGAYDRVTGDVVKDTLSSSLVWRTHVGFRPFANAGFYMDVGYGLVTLGGGTTAATLLADLTGQTLPQGHSDLDISLHSSLHMFDVEFGWRIPLPHSFVAWAALGGAFTFASSTRLSVEPTGDPDFDQAARQLADTSANYLDHVYRSYVFTPVISAGASYVFF